MSVLQITNLRLRVSGTSPIATPVDGVSFSIAKGEVFGLAGESGSGKSMTALSILRILPPQVYVAEGMIVFNGTDMLRADESTMRSLRGSAVSIVFQDPSNAFNPVFTVGYQLEEALRAHQRIADGGHSRACVLSHLERVRIADPAQVFRSYPHQLSGGMKQRAMIAMALIHTPQLVILDEPTTALDVTIQSEILDLLEEIAEEESLSMLFISHDFGVLSRICHRLGVMHRGKIVEMGSAREIIRNPKEPYTRTLIESVKALA